MSLQGLCFIVAQSNVKEVKILLRLELEVTTHSAAHTLFVNSHTFTSVMVAHMQEEHLVLWVLITDG